MAKRNVRRVKSKTNYSGGMHRSVARTAARHSGVIKAAAKRVDKHQGRAC